MERLVDLPTCWITLKTFDNLYEYSSSLSTGTTIGKVWKARWLNWHPEHQDSGRWILCQYVESPAKPGLVTTKVYKIACAGNHIPRRINMDGQFMLTTVNPEHRPQQIQRIILKCGRY